MNTRNKTARKNHHIETGKRIRIEIILQGLTQEEAAEKLDISERQYRRYENGESGINWIILEKFDDIGFDIHYIFSGVVEADYYVTKGFEVMPEEEYDQITERFYEIVTLGLHTFETNQDTLRELCSIFDYCKNYGKEHTNMFDIPGIKYENFESFVDNWDLVEHENKEYLHFTMDENFYKFLIEVYNLMAASKHKKKSKRMEEAFNIAFESLKGNFSDSEQPKEYVLIPADDMLEIATDNVESRKSLSEVVDILNLYSPKKKKIKIKRTELE